MNTIYDTAELAPTTVSTHRVSNFFRRCWGAFQSWRERERLWAELYSLNDKELMDIGITRGEIDYVTANRSIDPRGIV